MYGLIYRFSSFTLPVSFLIGSSISIARRGWVAIHKVHGAVVRVLVGG